MIEAPFDVLVVGGGAREEALIWKLSQSPHIRNIYGAPGNPGTERIGINIPLGPNDIDQLVRFSADNQIGLTMVGPEDPLSKGIANAFAENGQLLFGPTKEAAQLESSKSYAIDFMERHDIPHARSRSF